MSKIHIVARLHLHEGKLDAARAAAEGAVATVREKDPGTIRYDWFLSEDQGTITVLESYESSEAVMAHMGNMQELLAGIGDLGTLELEVFGNPSEELAAAAAAMGPKVHSLIVAL